LQLDWRTNGHCRPSALVGQNGLLRKRGSLAHRSPARSNDETSKQALPDSAEKTVRDRYPSAPTRPKRTSASCCGGAACFGFGLYELPQPARVGNPSLALYKAP